MNNVVNFPDKQKANKLPSNLIKVDTTKKVRIPILSRMYELDGELYYELQGDPTPRKWKDYSHMNFN